MSNTKEGGKKVVRSMIQKYGSYEAYQAHMREIAHRGGSNGVIYVPEHLEARPVDINEEYTILSNGTLLGKDGNAKKPQFDAKGYLRVQVYVDARPVTEKVHRLVARHFLKNPDHLPQVNHIDGDKTNNDVANLEWVSQQSNMDHAKIHNLIHRNKNAQLLAGQVLTALENRYVLGDICRANGFGMKTIKRYMADATPAPITTLKLGRRRQMYYFDKNRGRFRIVKKDTGIESAQFLTEAEAIRYIESQSALGGFAANRELARIAGAKGGRISRKRRKEMIHE